MDITSMIAGPSRPKKSLRNNDNPKRSLKKRKRGAEDDDEDDKGDMGADSDVSGFEEVGEGVSFANDLNDDLDEDEEDFIRTAMEKKNIKDGAKVVKGRKDLKGKKGVSGGGSFQSLGLHPSLLRALLLRGFTTPTPIQRLALPHILSSPPRDCVGMARTGSGKTLAYLVPLVQKLGGNHSPTFGARALVLVPTRELALQILKVGKDLARGYKGEKKGTSEGADSDMAKGEGLRWGLVVGGDALEEQFDMMAANPDVVIATPGRLLHLIVEMNLDLKSVGYVVFDEADRLFEMGFATQLQEILHRLPANRQTLLFSATLPKSLVEFAQAGLQNPKLIRLDADTKISSDLQMAFLSVKPTEKEAALLCLLRDVIGVPQGKEVQEAGEAAVRSNAYDDDEESGGDSRGKWRKRNGHGHTAGMAGSTELAPHQTLVFAATKHHVEYLSNLLSASGYAVSQIYGSMDQVARRSHLSAFRFGRTNILCVTDVAARGIDIPILENVINYDYPTNTKAFIHRVGRTARAGRKGWAYSIITNNEIAHLLDLELFLSRSLKTCPLPPSSSADGVDYSSNLILGTIPRERLDADLEHLNSVLLSPSSPLVTLKDVARKGQKLYEKSQQKASAESYRRAKDLMTAGNGLAGSVKEAKSVHPIFSSFTTDKTAGAAVATEAARANLLAAVNSFRPPETVFEVGKRGKTPAAQLMRTRRVQLQRITGKQAAAAAEKKQQEEQENEIAAEEEEEMGQDGRVENLEAAAEGDIEAVFGVSSRKRKREETGDFKDPQFYLSHVQAGAAAEKGYSVTEGGSFTAQAHSAAFDLGADDEKPMAAQKSSMLRWDRKRKKFVKGDGIGADNKKLIKSESGAKLPVSFKSGAFDDWRSRAKVSLPKVGEAELKGRTGMGGGPGRKFRHKGGFPGGKSEDGATGKGKGFKGGARQVGKGRSGGSGLKSVDQIRKVRAAKDVRKRRSTQPGRKGKK